jgi:hypothetical protein
MDKMPEEIAFEEKHVYCLDWFTYAWVRKEGKLGLDEYAAKCLGFDSRLELNDSPNDTSYSVTIKEGEISEEEDLIWETKDSTGKVTRSVSCFGLEQFLLFLANKGFLPYGDYLISVSW